MIVCVPKLVYIPWVAAGKEHGRVGMNTGEGRSSDPHPPEKPELCRERGTLRNSKTWNLIHKISVPLFTSMAGPSARQF